MIGQYMDIVFADDMPEFKPREIGGKTLQSVDLTDAERDHLVNGRTENPIGRPYKKVVNDIGPMSPQQESVLVHLSQLAKEFKDGSKKQRRDWMLAGDPRSPLLVETAAANAGLDVRLYTNDRDSGDHPQNKATRIVKNVVDLYRGHPQANQVIFIERGFSDTVTRTKKDKDGNKTTYKVDKFNLVSDMVDKMVAGGIARHEIAVVDGAVSKAKRKEIADAMNSGRLRVVIGNYKTLGVGVNMQRNLRAMHHAAAPWMPGELEQGNGRGWRQGNQWNTVLEYRYITDKLDGRRWQVLAVKDRFIKAFLKADEDVRVIDGDAVSMEEGDSVSDLMQTLSEAAGDPRLMMKHKLEADVRKLQNRDRLHAYGIQDAVSQARRLRSRAQDYAHENERWARDAEAYRAASEGGKFSAAFAGETATDRKAADDLLVKAVQALAKGDEDIIIGNVQGFKVTARWNKVFDEPRYEVRTANESYGVKPSIASIEATLRGLSARIDRNEAEIADMLKSADRMDAAAAEPFAQADVLEKKKQQLSDLEGDMARSPAVAPAWLRQDAPVGTKVYVRDGEALVPRIVEGHRWTDDGYFVVTDQGMLPYLDVMDENGLRVYDPRPFTPPPSKEPPKGQAPKDGEQAMASAEVALPDRGGHKLTPLAETSRPRIERMVRDVINSILGHHVEVSLTDADHITTATDTAAWGETLGGKMARGESKTIGAYWPISKIIEIALGSPHWYSTAFHEAWHGAENQLLTDRELALLHSETPRLRDYVRRARGPQQAKAADTEIRAMAAEDYATNRANGGTGYEPEFHIGIRRIFEKFLELLRRIKNALKGLGFRTAEDVFEDLYAGRMKDRPERETPGIPQRVPAASPEMPLAAPSRGVRSFDLPKAIADKTSFAAGTNTLVRNVADQMVDALQIKSAIEAATGQELPEWTDVYMHEALMHGRIGERGEDLWHEHVDPILRDLKKNGVDRDRFNRYLYVAHAMDRNAHIASINPKMPDGGSGISDARAAQELMAFQRSKDFLALERNAQHVYAMLEEAVQRRVDGGLLSQAAADAMRAAFGPRYVPLRGKDEMFPDADLPRSGPGMSVKGKEYKQAMGRGEGNEADDPFSYAVLSSTESILRSEKNRVAHSLYLMALEFPHEDLWSVAKMEPDRRISPITGLVEDYYRPVSPEATDVIGVKIRGVQHVITIHHPGLLSAMKNLGKDQSMDVIKTYMRPITRVWSSLRTRWNPEFTLTNFTRDQADANVAIYVLGHGARGNALYAKNLTKALRAVGSRELWNKQNSYMAELYDEFRLSGGKLTWLGHGYEVDEIVKEMNRRMNPGLKDKILFAPKLAAKLLEAVNDYLEVSTRFALYATAKELGYSPNKSAMVAREGTVNFDRKGMMMATVRASVPFVNPNIQANLRYARMVRGAAGAVKAHKWAVRRVGMGMFITGFLLAVFNRFFGGDDDDGVAFWDKLTSYEKQHNLIVMTGNKAAAIKQPLFAEIMLPYRAGQILADLMLSDQMTWGKAAGDMMASVLNTLPFIGQSHYGAPPIAGAGYDLATNTKATGAPIHRDPFPNSKEAGLPHSQSKFPWTDERWQHGAELIGTLFGGSNFERPRYGGRATDLYPEEVQFLVNETLGGTWTFASGAYTVLEKLYQGVEPSEVDIREYPFLRRFYRTGTEGWTNEQYREKRKEGNDATAATKAMKEAGVDSGPDFERLQKKVDTVMPHVKEAQSALKRLYQEADRVRADKSMSEDDRAARLNVLREQTTTVRKEALQKIRTER
jgi:hypothetical protein